LLSPLQSTAETATIDPVTGTRDASRDDDHRNNLQDATAFLLDTIAAKHRNSRSAKSRRRRPQEPYRAAAAAKALGHEILKPTAAVLGEAMKLWLAR
jgi:hypothetical protein